MCSAVAFVFHFLALFLSFRERKFWIAALVGAFFSVASVIIWAVSCHRWIDARPFGTISGSKTLERYGYSSLRNEISILTICHMYMRVCLYPYGFACCLHSGWILSLVAAAANWLATALGVFWPSPKKKTQEQQQQHHQPNGPTSTLV